jgi:hypothetical protein
MRWPPPIGAERVLYLEFGVSEEYTLTLNLEQATFERVA